MHAFVTRLSLALVAHGLLGLEVTLQLDEPDKVQVNVLDPISRRCLSVAHRPVPEGAPEAFVLSHPQRVAYVRSYNDLAQLVAVLGFDLLGARARVEHETPPRPSSPFMERALCYLRAMGVSGVAVENAPDLVEGVDVNEALTFRDQLLGTVSHVTRGVVPVRAMRPYGSLAICYTVVRSEPKDGMVKYPVGNSLGFALTTAIRTIVDARAYALEAIDDNRTD